MAQAGRGGSLRDRHPSNVIVENWNGIPFEPYRVRDTIRFLRTASPGRRSRTSTTRW
jgi:hypothetical protein